MHLPHRLDSHLRGRHLRQEDCRKSWNRPVVASFEGRKSRLALSSGVMVTLTGSCCPLAFSPGMETVRYVQDADLVVSGSQEWSPDNRDVTWRPLRSRLDPPDLLPGQTLPIFFFFSSLPTQASSTLLKRKIALEIKNDNLDRVPMDKLLVNIEVAIFTFVALGTHTPDDLLTLVAVGHLEG